MTDDTIALKKRNAQELYAQGLIGPEEYEAIGQKHGFVSPPPKTSAAKVKQVLTYGGYASLAVGAAAEIAQRQWPQLKGPPIEFITSVLSAVLGALFGS